MIAPTRATGPRVTVVSPFFDEEKIIADAVRRMARNLESQFGDTWELVLVDDGSRDASREIVVGVLEENPTWPVRLIGFDQNQGRGRALKAGIDVAAGDIVVTTEADCSWGDRIVAELVRELDEHPETDFVVASPHLPGGGLVNVPGNRRFLTRMGNRLIRLFFDARVSMSTGMTRAYRRPVIAPLVVDEAGKEFHLEVLLKLITLGFRFREIPATITWMKERPTGSDRRAGSGEEARRSSTKIYQTICRHLKFVATAQPVKTFAWLAVIALVSGLGFFGTSVAFLLDPDTPSVYTALVGLSLLLFAVLFTGFSILFYQFRQSLRESWRQSYPRPFPPSARTAVAVHPVGESARGESAGGPGPATSDAGLASAREIPETEPERAP